MTVHTYNLDHFCYHEFRRPFVATELGGFTSLLPQPLHRGAWIAGGAVRRMVLDEPTGNDIDVFFATGDYMEDYRDQLAVMPHARFIENTDRRLIYELTGAHRTVKVDLVYTAYFSSIDALFSDFDLTCCQFAIDHDHLYVGPYAMLHAGMRIAKPACTTKLRMWPQHLVRYLRQGWRADQEAIDILVAEMERDPTCLKRGAEYSGR